MRIRVAVFTVVLASTALGAPVVLAAAAPDDSGPARLSAQFRNVSGPQPFKVQTGQQAGFVIAVTQPGPITVNAEWRGSPLVLQLSGPIAQPVQMRGETRARIEYTVTSADIQKGAFWAVTLDAPGNELRVPDTGPRKIDIRLLAEGTVNIQRPPADPAVLKQSLDAIETALQNEQNQAVLRLTAPGLQLGRGVTGTADLPFDPALYPANTFTTTDLQAVHQHGITNYGPPIVRSHRMYQGSSGTDEYFIGVQLKNGWKVDSVALTQSGSHATATVTESHEGTSDPHVVVAWQFVPGGHGPHAFWGTVTYTLNVRIKGPVGTSWK